MEYVENTVLGEMNIMINLDIVRYLNYIFALIFIGCIGYQFIYIFIPTAKIKK